MSRENFSELLSFLAVAQERSFTKAAAGFVRQFLEIERIHRASQANVEVIDFALGQSDDRHAGEFQVLEQGGDIGLVARDTVQRLCQDDLEAAEPTSLPVISTARISNVRSSMPI